MKLQEVKQRFMAMRNGVLADTLRRSGAAPHKLIFGLNLPQLNDIAREAGEDEELAEALWADTGCRESRLLAPMLFPKDSIDEPTHWLEEVQSAEEADVLVFKLLRHSLRAVSTACTAFISEDPLVRYAALRLLYNVDPAGAVDLARDELKRHEPVTRILANQIITEQDEQF